MDLLEQAISIGAKVLWGQIDVYDDRAAELAEGAGSESCNESLSQN